MENSNGEPSLLDEEAWNRRTSSGNVKDTPAIEEKNNDRSKTLVNSNGQQNSCNQQSFTNDYQITRSEKMFDNQPIQLNSVSSLYSSSTIMSSFSFNQLPGTNKSSNKNNTENHSSNSNSNSNTTNIHSTNMVPPKSKGFVVQSDSASSSRKSSFSAIKPDYSMRSPGTNFSALNGTGHGHAATVHSLLGIHRSSSSMSVNEIAVCQTDSEDDESVADDEYFRKQNRMLLQYSESATINRQNSFTSAPPSSLNNVVTNSLAMNHTTQGKFYRLGEIDSLPTSPKTNFSDISTSIPANTPQSQINNSFMSSSRLSSPFLASPGSGGGNTVASEYSKSPGIHFRSSSKTKRNLMPRLKSFSRIASELQNEISPFDSEIRHEFRVTSALRDEDEILESALASSILADASGNRTYKNNLKKFEMINKINEEWSRNKFDSDSKNNVIINDLSSNIDLRSMSNSDKFENNTDLFSKPAANTPNSQSLGNSIIQIPKRKRKSFSSDERYIPSTKKRIVTVPSPVLSTASSPASITSPSLTGIFPPSRRNSNKLMQRASDDLESMSLR